MYVVFVFLYFGNTVICDLANLENKKRITKYNKICKIYVNISCIIGVSQQTIPNVQFPSKCEVGGSIPSTNKSNSVNIIIFSDTPFNTCTISKKTPIPTPSSIIL